MFRDPKAIAFFTNEVILTKVNAEVDSNLAKEYKVSGYPTAVLIDKDGKEIDRLVGYDETDAYLQTLRDYQKGIGTLADLLSRAESDSDRELALEIANKYKYRGGSEEALAWFIKVTESGDRFDSLSAVSRMAVADLHRRTKELDIAIDLYKQIMKDFAGLDLNGLFPEQDALYYVAYIYEKKFDTTNALAHYEAFVNDFPESEDVKYAQKHIDKLTAVESKTEE